MIDIEWSGTNENFDVAHIQAVEASLGINLPNDFIEVVKVHDGFTPYVGEVDFPDPTNNGRIEQVVLGQFFKITPELDEETFEERESEFISINKLVAEYCPGLIVFASDAGGWFFGFDYTTDPVAPPVVLFVRDVEIKVPLARSLTELFEISGPPVDYSNVTMSD